MARASASRKIRSLSLSETTIPTLIESWERSLRAANLSPKTLLAYTGQVRRFGAWLRTHERSDVLSRVTRADVEAYLADVLDSGGAPKSADSYRNTLALFARWAIGEDEITRNPVEGVRRPVVPKKSPAVLTDDDLRAILRVCEGNEFAARRDTAILRLLFDAGLRRQEIAGLAVADVDLAACEARVYGKGRKERRIAFHAKTARALDRWLRVRERHVDAALPALWLGAKGRLTGQGLYTMVKRRAKQAGIARNVWPHLFRHTWAHQWLAQGGQERSLMKMAGWESTEMIGRYGAALAEERARDEAKRMQGGDRL